VADQSKKSHSGKPRRWSVGEFRTRASRRLSVEMIEGRLMLSVAPLTVPDPANTIFLAPFATPTSGENLSGAAPATPPSEQGGFINPSGPTIIHIGEGNIQTSGASSLQTNAIGQQVDYETLISRGVTDANIGPNAVSNGINPAFVRIEFIYSGEGGPIGIAPMNRPGSQSPGGDSPAPLSAERNSSAVRPESSMLAYAGSSKLSGEWARPAISEVASDEPEVARRRQRFRSVESDVLPTSLPKANVEHSGSPAAGADSVNSNAQPGEIPVDAVMMREPCQGDRLIDRAMATHDSWIVAAQQSAFSARHPSILSPSSHIDFILDDQTIDQHAPLILTLKPDDRPQKAAALKHTSMINLLRSSLSYEPVLVALLLDYVAARHYQHEDKKRAGSASQPIRRQ
jgi:hypothetical protein